MTWELASKQQQAWLTLVEVVGSGLVLWASHCVFTSRFGQQICKSLDQQLLGCVVIGLALPFVNEFLLRACSSFGTPLEERNVLVLRNLIWMMIPFRSLQESMLFKFY